MKPLLRPNEKNDSYEIILEGSTIPSHSPYTTLVYPKDVAQRLDLFLNSRRLLLRATTKNQPVPSWPGWKLLSLDPLRNFNPSPARINSRRLGGETGNRPSSHETCASPASLSPRRSTYSNRGQFRGPAPSKFFLPFHRRQRGFLARFLLLVRGITIG